MRFFIAAATAVVAAAAAAAASSASASASAAAALPNIVMVMTDDQDVELGGASAEVMPRLHALLADAGATGSKMYVHVPVCCPSRSSFHSGQYQHNNQVRGNSIGANCSSTSWQQGPESRSVATYLQRAGYATSFAGKYLNDYGDPAVGGVAHVPAGWTNWQGLVGNSVYYHYTISNNGAAEAHAGNPGTDYLPSVILNKTLAFLQKTAAAAPGARQPFFAVLSTPSCHGPQDALPKYQGAFEGKGAPRTPAFHAEAADTHWLQATEGAGYGLNASLAANSAAFSDLVFRRRWQTLLSVDDILDAVVAEVEALGELDNTFFVYTTDNGYVPRGPVRRGACPSAAPVRGARPAAHVPPRPAAPSPRTLNPRRRRYHMGQFGEERARPPRTSRRAQPHAHHRT